MGLLDIRSNPIMLTDTYNNSHQFLKENTDIEVSHLYNRKSGMILQGFREIANSILSIQITKKMVDQAKKHADRKGLPFPYDVWMRVVNEFNGYVPIAVEALEEGTWVPAGTPFAQVYNTVEGFGELVTWFEGILMMAYFPSACATEAFHIRKYLEQKMEEYGFDESFLKTRVHSFGFRGHKSLEDAYHAGTAWNIFLYGTDDFHTAMHTPDAPISSIMASAHKVIQQFDDEYKAMEYQIDATKNAGKSIVSFPIDTYDADRFIKEYTLPLANYADRKGVHIVLRPDSGYTWQQAVDVYEIVERNGLKNVSVIIGEDMSFENMKKLDKFLEENGVPLNFVSVGIGAGFYKHIERDTLGWAMKTAYSNGKPRMKFSMVPIKRSIPDKVDVLNVNGKMTVVPRDVYNNQNELGTLYKTVYYHDQHAPVPWINYADWNKTREIALQQTGKQKVIALSKETEKQVEELRKQYRV